MSNAAYLGTSLDNPPLSTDEGFESAIGKAVNHLRHGRRVPYDLARELMDQGFDLHGIEASTRNLND